jgi:hypothetical protein
MRHSNDKGSNSYWIIFKAGLPTRITIDWKITKGVVCLSFWRGAKPYPREIVDLSSLPPGSAMIASGTTKIIETPWQRTGDSWVELSDAHIRHALTLALGLLNFYHSRVRAGEFA